MLDRIGNILQSIGDFFGSIGQFFTDFISQAKQVIERIGDAAEFVYTLLDTGVDLVAAFIPADLLGWMVAAITIILILVVLKAVL